MATANDPSDTQIPSKKMLPTYPSDLLQEETIEPKDTDALLGPRGTPPPRYSSINPSWEAEQVTTTQQVPPSRTPAQHNPVPQNAVIHPGWLSWVPGPAQFFPPGLEHLTNVDTLTIHKKKRKIFRVCRDDGQQIYHTTQARIHKATSFRILNNANLDVITMMRAKENTGCCSFKSTHMEVSFPPGNMVGVVQGTKMEFTVHNPSGDLLFFLQLFEKAKRSRISHGYEVISSGRFTVGSITQEREGCCCGKKVVCLVFPPDIDICSKALLLAAAISIKEDHW